MERRWLRWSTAALWLGLVVCISVFGQHAGWQRDAPLAVGGFLLGVGFGVTALLLWTQEGQRTNAVLFAVLTLVWITDQSASAGLGALTGLAVWIGGFTQMIAATVLLRYPGDRLDRNSRIFVVIGLGVIAVAETGMVLTGRPADWLVPVHTPWPSLLADENLFQIFSDVKYAWWSVGAAIFLVLLWRRWARLGSLERRILAPILVTAVITALTIALRLLQPWMSPDVAHGLEILRAYSAAGVSIAFAVSALELQLARGAVADLAAELTHSVTLDHVRACLGRALSDPRLEILYWVPDRRAFVDSSGTPHELPVSGRLVARVSTNEGKPLAAILADPSLQRHRRLVDAAVAVSRLALENAQLQVELKSQLVAVHEARARLLHEGLEQRRRLERDLHDGAQQRLLAIGMRLGAIETTTSDYSTAEAVQVARKELHLALEELRDLAHGLYPAVLSQAGLGAALEAVIERLPVPVHLTVAAQRWASDVESTAYLIACEALTNACKHAGPCTVHLTVDRRGHEIVIDVRDDGEGSAGLDETALPGIRDRLDALGGRLRVDSQPGVGTHLVAVFPCG